MPSERDTTPNVTSGGSDEHRVVAHPVVESDEALGGVAVRMTHEFLLRSVRLISEINDGDLIEGLVILTIISGNISYLDRDPSTSGQFLAVEDVVPDEMRRPISVLAIASTLDLPYETTRRYVSKHLKAGHCKRVKGGLVAIGESLVRDEYHEAIRTNMVNIRRFYAALKRAGIRLD
jgi:hypothetical protein